MKTNEELLNIAKEASKNAYCVYSKFPVGACVLYSGGNYYAGCNIENSSFGLTLCAERNAISTAIASGETGQIVKIAIIVCSVCFIYIYICSVLCRIFIIHTIKIIYDIFNYRMNHIL